MDATKQQLLPYSSRKASLLIGFNLTGMPHLFPKYVHLFVLSVLIFRLLLVLTVLANISSVLPDIIQAGCLFIANLSSLILKKNENDKA